MSVQPKRILRVREALCNGCLSCQVYCATANEGISAPVRARVRVPLDPFEGQHRIHICRQCKKALCVQACPEDAIVASSDGTYWIIDHERCTDCRECLQACPFGAIFEDPIGGHLIRCHTCQGDPLCAQVCPMGALAWEERKGAAEKED